MKKGGRSRFPDLNNDGKITMADILKGRGVGRRKRKAAGGMYVRPGKQMGVGGALLTLGKNIAQGKKLGSGVLKGVGRAAVTPGSGVSAGLGFAGALAGKSKNPALQKLGKGLGVAGGLSSMLNVGGGGLKNIGAMLKGSGAGTAGVVDAVAGSGGAGILNKAKDFLNLGNNVGGGAGKGILENLAGKFLAKDGMKVSYGDGGSMDYEHGGSVMEGRKPMLIIKMDEGGITDPVPNGNGDTETYGEPRVIKTQTTSGEFQEDKPLTGGDYVTTIGAINPEGGSLDSLDDDKKSSILSSKFGQMYLSGEGALDDQYKAYTTKVFDFIDNNPEEALSRINDMMETNEGFQTKLKGKSDEEKLAITRNMMTDGKIGDFHGTILTNPEKTPLPQFYSPQTSNIRTEQGEGILVGTGMRSVKPNQMGEYLAAAEAAGISREELSKDTEKTRNFLNEYLDDRGFQQSSPSTGDESGTSTGGYSQYFIDEAREGADAALQARSDQARIKARDWYSSINPRFAALQDEMQKLAAYNEQEGTDFRKVSDMEADMAEKADLAYQQEKEGNMADIKEEQRPAFMEEYFKSKGITEPSERDYMLAEQAYDRDPDMFKKRIVDLGSASFAQGGKMTILKKGGKSYRGGGALSSLIR